MSTRKEHGGHLIQRVNQYVSALGKCTVVNLLHAQYEARGEIILLFAQTLHQPRNPLDSAPSSIQLYLRTAEHYTQWLQGQGYGVSEMDGALLQRYVSGLMRYRSGKLPKAAQGLSHLV